MSKTQKILKADIQETSEDNHVFLKKKRYLDELFYALKARAAQVCWRTVVAIVKAVFEEMEFLTSHVVYGFRGEDNFGIRF